MLTQHQKMVTSWTLLTHRFGDRSVPFTYSSSGWGFLLNLPGDGTVAVAVDGSMQWNVSVPAAHVLSFQHAVSRTLCIPCGESVAVTDCVWPCVGVTQVTTQQQMDFWLTTTAPDPALRAQRPPTPTPTPRVGAGGGEGVGLPRPPTTPGPVRPSAASVYAQYADAVGCVGVPARTLHLLRCY